MKRLMLLGAPGAGKGTQAKKLCEYLGVPHISTGQIFRNNIQRNSELGIEAQKYISEGNLVPDDLTNKMVFNCLNEPKCAEGFILDGYPRTLDQASALTGYLEDKALGLDAVIDIMIPEDEIIGRLLNRAKIEGRADDTREVIAHRIEVYYEQTEPLLKYYRDKDVLITVDGHGTIDDVWSRIKDIVTV